MVYKIIATGSTGNAVLIFDSILVDVGVPYSLIKEYIYDLQIITWSHKHYDHFNLSTIKKIVEMRPTLRIAVVEHEYERALQTGCKNIDVLEILFNMDIVLLFLLALGHNLISME